MVAQTSCKVEFRSKKAFTLVICALLWASTEAFSPSSSASRHRRQYQTILRSSTSSRVNRDRNRTKQRGSKRTKPHQGRLPQPSLRAQLDYARNGHAVLRNILDPALLHTLHHELHSHGRQQELLAWQQKVEVAAASPELAQNCRSIQACRQELLRLGVPADALPFLQYFNSWQSVPKVYDLCLSLAETAAVLMDVESVRLYQDALFWKRPGDGPTPWHADARMAPFDTSHMITIWIPLQAIPKSGTGLVFCSKSHADFSLPYWNEETNDPTSEWNQLEERYPEPPIDYMPMCVGDITAHAGWTLHCADGNASDTDRLALAISYVDARAPVRDDDDDDDKGDSEDAWSYQDWIKQVPKQTRGFIHKRVPIVWPPSKRRRRRSSN